MYGGLMQNRVLDIDAEVLRHVVYAIVMGFDETEPMGNDEAAGLPPAAPAEQMLQPLVVIRQVVGEPIRRKAVPSAEIFIGGHC